MPLQDVVVVSTFIATGIEPIATEVPMYVIVYGPGAPVTYDGYATVYPDGRFTTTVPEVPMPDDGTTVQIVLNPNTEAERIYEGQVMSNGNEKFIVVEDDLCQDFGSGNNTVNG